MTCMRRETVSGWQVNGFVKKSGGSSSLYAQELTWGFLDVLGTVLCPAEFG